MTSTTTAAELTTTASSSSSNNDTTTAASNPPGNSTAIPPPPPTTTGAGGNTSSSNAMIITIRPILKDDANIKKFQDLMRLNQTALAIFKTNFVFDLARVLNIDNEGGGIKVTKITMVNTGDWELTVDFPSALSGVTDVTSGKPIPVKTFLQQKLSKTDAAWMRNTTAYLKVVGADGGYVVLGAAMVGAKAADEVDAPVCEELCFYQCDCVISAVIAGVSVVAAIVLVTCICGKLFGGDKEEKKQKEMEDELEKRARLNKSGHYEQEMRRPSLQVPQLSRQASFVNPAPATTAPVVAAAAAAAPAPAPRAPATYAVDDDL